MTDVTVLGIGNMGAAMVRVLCAAGRTVTVWNRTHAKAATLAALGAYVARAPEEAVAASPLTVAILTDNAAVTAALRAVPAGFFSGQVLLNLSTSAPQDVPACREALERGGLTYLDGAVSGHPQDIGHDTSQILVAGDRPAWESHRETIELLAGRVQYLGTRTGSASALDLAMVGCFQTVTLCAFVEAAAFYEASGGDVDALRAEGVRLLEKMRLQVDTLVTALSTRDFHTDQATCAVYLAALEQASASMSGAGVAGALTEAALATLRRTTETGHGGDGLAAQVSVLR